MLKHRLAVEFGRRWQVPTDQCERCLGVRQAFSAHIGPSAPEWQSGDLSSGFESMLKTSADDHCKAQSVYKNTIDCLSYMQRESVRQELIARMT